MEYIATFYSHFGAVRFRKMREKSGEPAKLMPVPRSLSSSCGTCVSFCSEDPLWHTKPEELIASSPSADEIEQLAAVCGERYEVLYSSAN